MKVLNLIAAYVVLLAAFSSPVMAELAISDSIYYEVEGAERNLEDMPAAEDMIGRLVEDSDRTDGGIELAHYYSGYYNSYGYGYRSNICRSGAYYCYTNWYHYVGSRCACYGPYGGVWFYGRIYSY